MQLFNVMRYSHLINLMTVGNWDKIIADHSIGPGSGAAAAICGPIWPVSLAPTTALSSPPDVPPGNVPY